MSASPVLAAVDVGTLVRSLLIAAVIVLPYGVWKYRQVQERRRSLVGPGPADDAPPCGPTLEAVVASIAALDPEVGGRIEVPDGCTVDGQPVDDRVAEVLVADALGRTGLQVRRRERTAAGSLLVCEPGTGGGAGVSGPGSDARA